MDEGSVGPLDSCNPESDDVLVEPTITDGCYDLIAGEYYVITTDENGCCVFTHKNDFPKYDSPGNETKLGGDYRLL